MDVVCSVALVAILIAASGCTGAPAGPTGPQASLAGVHFGTLLMRPTPGEPFEKPTDSILEWSAAGFGVLSNDPESRIYHMTVLLDGTAYGSTQGLGWVAYPYPGQLDGPAHLSPSLAVWNFPDIVGDPGLQVVVRDEPGGQNYTAVGSIVRGGVSFTIHLEVAVRDGNAAWAHLTVPGIPESPFMFRAGGQLPFPIAIPSHVATPRQQADGESIATDGHKMLIGLVKDYADHHGSVPDDVTPQTLQLELIGKTWPTNPFTGEPQRNDRSSGNFVWVKCSLKVGSYAGYGWDGLLVTRGYGSSQCPA